MFPDRKMGVAVRRDSFDAAGAAGKGEETNETGYIYK